MFVLKAFAAHKMFTNNVLGVTSPIGEISTKSLTFAREKGLYESVVSPDITLTTFTSAVDAVPTQLATDIIDEVATIVKYLYDKTLNTTGQVYRDELLMFLTSNYANVAFNFDLGQMVSDGTFYVPEWVSWESKNPVYGAGNVIRIWLSDQSFQAQYDGYEIVIIPPVDVLDNFFTPSSNVAHLLGLFTPSDVMARIQAAKNNYPETIIRAETFNYVDPYVPTNVYPTTWNLLIYGNAGDNIDVVQNALVEYVLAHSTHGAADWTALIPDLFKRTEFMIVPNWIHYAIPNRTLEAGIYSPTINPNAAIALIDRIVKKYPMAHINDNVEITVHPYKSLALIAVGSPDNKNAAYRLTNVFPDYIPVSTTSPDFNRMSADTQAWVNLLSNMIVVAETMGQFSSIPAGMSRTIRDGVLYLVGKHGFINYLVAAKSSVN